MLYENELALLCDTLKKLRVQFVKTDSDAPLSSVVEDEQAAIIDFHPENMTTADTRDKPNNRRDDGNTHKNVAGLSAKRAVSAHPAERADQTAALAALQQNDQNQEERQQNHKQEEERLQETGHISKSHKSPIDVRLTA